MDPFCVCLCMLIIYFSCTHPSVSFVLDGWDYFESRAETRIRPGKIRASVLGLGGSGSLRGLVLVFCKKTYCSD